jgi:hypothetical protein
MFSTACDFQVCAGYPLKLAGISALRQLPLYCNAIWKGVPSGAECALATGDHGYSGRL